MLFFLSPQYRRLAVPSVFFAAVIFFEEIFLKLYCFHGLTPEGCLFTLLFTLPPALLLFSLSAIQACYCCAAARPSGPGGSCCRRVPGWSPCGLGPRWSTTICSRRFSRSSP